MKLLGSASGRSVRVMRQSLRGSDILSSNPVKVFAHAMRAPSGAIPSSLNPKILFAVARMEVESNYEVSVGISFGSPCETTVPAGIQGEIAMVGIRTPS